MNILIVDDEPELAFFLSRLLYRLGHQSKAVFSASEAQVALQSVSFDLIISDLQMPETTGARFYDQLVAANSPMAARIGFMTGNALAPENQAFLEHSRRPYLEKPFDSQQVQAFIALLARPLQS